MKKFIVMAAVMSSFIMCKKGEVTGESFENTSPTSDTLSVQNAPSSVTKENSAVDSAFIKVKNFEKEVPDIVSKKIDSVAEKLGNISLKSEEKKTDSLKNEKQNITINVVPPKIIKETKIIYPKKTSSPEKTIRIGDMKKKGELQIGVSDIETAKKLVKEELYQHDALLKSQSTSSQNGNQKYAYLNVKVPLKKYEHLMESIGSLGEIEREDSQITEGNYRPETLCDLEITLYENEDKAAGASEPLTFGGKSAAAISSGWHVITSIFLFFLPLWPLFLLIGGVYYFVKKRKKVNP
ncbi:hypothetical protein ASG01_09280 [Chryseobacterium sp. Leaf180]|uniref:DUF4349 domain-containing protein n=1 Tax=Chryseobacterium sp. Leaf180 TaxID=1736289 RepID=UPI0006F8FB55|nr:DUF4349 domain-containing protein [Chryseobacterium sp. Leaf180]KQR93372.1 hypothetical protein ASG01_09280 [Chryseobacterium sp. Leaf180]